MELHTRRNAADPALPYVKAPSAERAGVSLCSAAVGCSISASTASPSAAQLAHKPSLPTPAPSPAGRLRLADHARRAAAEGAGRAQQRVEHLGRQLSGVEQQMRRLQRRAWKLKHQLAQARLLDGEMRRVERVHAPGAGESGTPASHGKTDAQWTGKENQHAKRKRGERTTEKGKGGLTSAGGGAANTKRLRLASGDAAGCAAGTAAADAEVADALFNQGRAFRLGLQGSTLDKARGRVLIAAAASGGAGRSEDRRQGALKCVGAERAAAHGRGRRSVGREGAPSTRHVSYTREGRQRLDPRPCGNRCAPQAKLGHAVAAAICTAEGWGGFPRDLRKAAAAFQREAEKGGTPAAQYRLAACFERGVCDDGREALMHIACITACTGRCWRGYRLEPLGWTLAPLIARYYDCAGMRPLGADCLSTRSTRPTPSWQAAASCKTTHRPLSGTARRRSAATARRYAGSGTCTTEASCRACH